MKFRPSSISTLMPSSFGHWALTAMYGIPVLSIKNSMLRYFSANCQSGGFPAQNGGVGVDQCGIRVGVFSALQIWPHLVKLVKLVYPGLRTNRTKPRENACRYIRLRGFAQ